MAATLCVRKGAGGGAIVSRTPSCLLVRVRRDSVSAARSSIRAGRAEVERFDAMG